MKTFKYFAMAAIAVVALVFASCGGSKSDDTFDVVVDNTTIGGKLSKYFSLADKTYKYNKGIIDKVTVELTCIEPLPENLKAYIGVEVLDEDGTVISAGKPDAWSFNDYEVLRQASPGQTVTIEIENHQNVGEEKPAKIRLSSIVEEDDDSTSSSYSSDSDDDDSSLDDDDSSDDDSDTASSSSGSQDWDALLNSYEQYVDKYISYMKKAAKGDMSALSEYPALMEKAQEFSEKMENAQGDMSASQWARYMKITNKMTQAAANMQ
ncbi:MAG: hypothetical protein IJ606_03855 [Bacteroidaceae bacterium]|jgi:hypothetical protein|nr:hypothetical protein [Bacteroidaceae bacterium]